MPFTSLHKVWICKGYKPCKGVVKYDKTVKETVLQTVGKAIG